MAIKTDEIPKSEGNVIGALLYNAITQFYADPANEAAFERWRAEREQKTMSRRAEA